MAKRVPIVGGNWKMNLRGAEADALTDALIQGLRERPAAEVFICPPFPYLERVGRRLREAGDEGGVGIRLGAQDVYHEPDGAFTGEVSCSMLRDLGVEVVLTGHSERRHAIGEPDVLVNAKTRAALGAGLTVVLCVGEKVEQREAGQTDAVNIAQVHYGLAGVTAEQMVRVVVAYEPVWAIGTGRTARPDDAQSAHRAIRRALENLYGSEVAEATRIEYGGSVKGENAADLFGQGDVDGGLIGGASLKAEEFLAIVRAAG